MVLTFLLIIAEARAFKMSTEHRGEFSINFNINWIEIQYLGTCWMPRRGISLYWNIQHLWCSNQSLSTLCLIYIYISLPECDIPVSGIPGPGNSSIFLWYRNRNRKNLVPKKVSEPVSKKFGTKKSLGTGLEKFWYRKKSRNRFRKNLVP